MHLPRRPEFSSRAVGFSHAAATTAGRATHLCTCLPNPWSICLRMHPFIHPSVCLFIRVSAHPSIHSLIYQIQFHALGFLKK